MQKECLLLSTLLVPVTAFGTDGTIILTVFLLLIVVVLGLTVYFSWKEACGSEAQETDSAMVNFRHSLYVRLMEYRRRSNDTERPNPSSGRTVGPSGPGTSEEDDEVFLQTCPTCQRPMTDGIQTAVRSASSAGIISSKMDEGTEDTTSYGTPTSCMSPEPSTSLGSSELSIHQGSLESLTSHRSFEPSTSDDSSEPSTSQWSPEPTASHDYLQPSTIQDTPEISPSISQDTTEISPSPIQESSEILLSTIQNNPEILSSTSKDNPESLSSTSKDNPEILSSTSKDNPEILSSTSKDNPEILSSSKDNPESLSSTSKDNPEILSSTSQDNPEILSSTSKDNPEILSSKSKDNPEILPSTCKDSTEILPSTSKDVTQDPPSTSKDIPQDSPSTSQDHPEILPSTSQDNTEILPSSSHDIHEPLSPSSSSDSLNLPCRNRRRPSPDSSDDSYTARYSHSHPPFRHGQTVINTRHLNRRCREAMRATKPLAKPTSKQRRVSINMPTRSRKRSSEESVDCKETKENSQKYSTPCEHGASSTNQTYGNPKNCMDLKRADSKGKRFNRRWFLKLYGGSHTRRLFDAYTDAMCRDHYRTLKFTSTLSMRISNRRTRRLVSEEEMAARKVARLGIRRHHHPKMSTSLRV